MLRSTVCIYITTCTIQRLAESRVSGTATVCCMLTVFTKALRQLVLWPSWVEWCSDLGPVRREGCWVQCTPCDPCPLPLSRCNRRLWIAWVVASHSRGRPSPAMLGVAWASYRSGHRRSKVGHRETVPCRFSWHRKRQILPLLGSCPDLWSAADSSWKPHLQRLQDRDVLLLGSRLPTLLEWWGALDHCLFHQLFWMPVVCIVVATRCASILQPVCVCVCVNIGYI